MRRRLMDHLIEPKDAVDLALKIVDRDLDLDEFEAKLTGSAEPSKSLVGHVSGPALDTWVLDAHKILHDCESDEEKQAALAVMREYVTSRRKVVLNVLPPALD